MASPSHLRRLPESFTDVTAADIANVINNRRERLRTDESSVTPTSNLIERLQ
jgi:hypothetical protein